MVDMATPRSWPIRSYVGAVGSTRGSTSWVVSWLPSESMDDLSSGSTSLSPAVNVPVIAPPAAMICAWSALTWAISAPGIVRIAAAWPLRPLAYSRAAPALANASANAD